MAKIRIHELSKELNVDSEAVIAFLGGDVKPMSGIEDADAERVRRHFRKKEQAADPAEKKASAAPPKAAPKDAPEGDETAKKKKPVFIFRPENSAYNQNRASSAGSRAGAPAGSGAKTPKTGQGSGNSGQSGKKPSGQAQDGRRTGAPRTPDRAPAGQRTVIKPSVPKTAEMYKENASDGPRKITDTTDFAKKLKKQQEEAEAARRAEEERIAAEEAARRAAEEAARKAAEEEAAARAKEEAARKAAEEAAKAAEESAKAAASKDASGDAPAKAQDGSDSRKKPERTDARPSDRPAKGAQGAAKKPDDRKGTGRGPAKDEKAQGSTDEKPAKKKPNFVFSTKTGTQDGRGQGARTGSGQGDRTGTGDRQGRYGSQTGERRPYNRDGQGAGTGQGRYGQGQGQGARTGSGQGDRRPYGQGQAGKAPQGQGAGQGGNRGIFGKTNRTGNTNIRFNKDNSAEGAGALSKADVHGKSSAGKHDKDKKNYDRTQKNAENFKNLSRDIQKKNDRRQEEEVIKMIVLPEVITMKELAEKMKQKPADLIKKLFLQGKMVTLNDELTYEEAEAVALDYDILCEKEEQVNVIEELLREDDEDEKDMVKRPPVVCVMGHVDHGKTSLLDAIRSTNVTAREAGGITQHIGAYMVECNGEKITFLDTPGHEAFTAMRMRGAQATDIAVLVVAADDGVMPQTVEAINHAKAAGVDIIVAVNKIDKPGANVDRVKQEMTEYGLVAEDWGGTTVFVPVSAKTRENIDQLLEMILLVTEVKELKANPNRALRGLVIEAKLDKGRGPVATVLVQKGTLKVGDFISCGSFYGRVRAMLDADGNAVKSATPSMPVEVLGLNGVPNAGEVAIGHKNERDARSYAETFIAEEKKKMIAETKKRLTMDSLFAEIQAGNIKELPIVIKADVQGSVEAVRTSLEKLSNEEVTVKVIHKGVGAISESDVSLASASNAIIIGFNVRPDNQAKLLAEQENVELKLYRVIYQAIDDVQAALKGMQAPVYEEKVIGHAEVRMLFKASSIGMIAGSYVLDGIVRRNAQVRVTRGKDRIYEGVIQSLKRFKDDAKEVREGFECGIVLEKFNDLQEGDVIEAFEMVQVEPK